MILQCSVELWNELHSFTLIAAYLYTNGWNGSISFVVYKITRKSCPLSPQMKAMIFSQHETPHSWKSWVSPDTQRLMFLMHLAITYFKAFFLLGRGVNPPCTGEIPTWVRSHLDQMLRQLKDVVVRLLTKTYSFSLTSSTVDVISVF